MSFTSRAETSGGGGRGGGGGVWIGGEGGGDPISTKMVSSVTTIATRWANFWRKEKNTT